ncbi:MAG: hypothetical protein K9L66_07190 [Spirochaetaceae bacterium]|nr:hypothetical protein [Spirochaetaceae bacterium]
MKDRFSHHFAILPEAQRKVWPQLAPFKERFVLYRGTALALRIGHRQSSRYRQRIGPPSPIEHLHDSAPHGQ